MKDGSMVSNSPMLGRGQALIILALGLLMPSWGEGQDRWVVADMATIRLSPRVFEQLPASILGYLEARGCVVPQSLGDDKPHNVIWGSFMKPDQLDWAVLCSTGRSSRVLVFLGGSTDTVGELGLTPDRRYLQIYGPEAIGFSRRIEVADPKYIQRQKQRYPPEQRLPRLAQEGIEDHFLGKGSSVHFYVDGRWTELQGAD